MVKRATKIRWGLESNFHSEVRSPVFNNMRGTICLNIGFATTNNLLKLRKKFDVVYGIDNDPVTKYHNPITPSYFQKLEKQNIFIVFADYNKILKHFPSNYVDTIIMSYSWYGAKQRKRLAEELYRITKKDGMLYLKHPLTVDEVKLIRGVGWKLIQLYGDDEYIFIK